MAKMTWEQRVGRLKTRMHGAARDSIGKEIVVKDDYNERMRYRGTIVECEAKFHENNEIQKIRAHFIVTVELGKNKTRQTFDLASIPGVR